MCSARSRRVQITSKGLDNEGIAQKLLEEEKAAMVPGSAFGIGFVRCSFATQFEKIDSFVKRCR